MSEAAGMGSDGVTGRSEQGEQADSRPVVLGPIVGLGWGLALGLVDGLTSLLEGDVSELLGRRLLTLAYLMVYNALLLGLVMLLVGVITWLALCLTQKRADRARLLGLYIGLCAAFSTAAYLLQRFEAGSVVLTLSLALIVGLGAGWLVRTAAKGVSPSRWALVSKTVLAVLAVAAVTLLGVFLYRQFIRDLPALNPRITDQVPSPERPNIVLISIDALRADRLGIYGNDEAASPHIDALAREGLVFQQAISQASSTVPAVASFMTSLHPTELGIITDRDWIIDDMRVTLAEALQVAGYRTQGYVTNGHLVPSKGYAQGFDGYVAPEPGRPYGIDRLRAQSILPGLACRGSNLACELFDRGHALLFDRLLVLENEGGRVNARALRFIHRHRDEQFFLWLHYMEPHAKYRPTQSLGALPASVSPDREEYLRSWQPADKKASMVMRQDDPVAIGRLYDGEVLDADRWVGEIWDQIQALGLDDRTLFVLTSDHGEEFADHGQFGHGHTVYQELDWVPLILTGPVVSTPGRVVQEPVPMLDLMPTLLDVAGAPVPDEVRGESLLPVLQGEAPARRPIYSECPARRSLYDDKALRLGDNKLIYNVRLDSAELYDLAADPVERTDLSAIEPERTAAMRDQLRAWTAASLETWASLPQAGSAPEEADEAMQEALRNIGY
ncbi:sulfatase [Chloroflexota bacterium]